MFLLGRIYTMLESKEYIPCKVGTLHILCTIVWIVKKLGLHMQTLLTSTSKKIVCKGWCFLCANQYLN